jgi:hypothetical protein
LLFQIPAARAEAQPKWQPESDARPPIGLKQACTLARAALKARRPELDDDLKVAEVHISEISWTTRPGSWFYEVRFHAKRNGKPIAPWAAVGVILMDGTSVEPTITRKTSQPEQR